MHTFGNLLKLIRKESRLTQGELAVLLNVSKILITTIETGAKEPSKLFIIKLSKALDVNPISITPFLFKNDNKLSLLEEKMINIGLKLQEKLIKNKSKKLLLKFKS